MKTIRWTIAGQGGALNNRRDDWSLVCDLVDRAEELGLRVEVAELEEEQR